MLDEVRWLAHRVLDLSIGSPSYNAVDRLVSSLDGPVRIVVMGRAKVGKSTLVNALIGENVAATAPGICTRVVTTYQWGPTPRAWARLRGGEERELAAWTPGAPNVPDLDGLEPSEVAEIVLEHPLERLKGFSLVDTPGIEVWTSNGTEEVDAALELVLQSADAVLHMLGHLHASAPSLLDDLARSAASPVGGIGRVLVLARADELGGAGLSAMETARRIAARYASDPRLHRLCQWVLPVASLAAEGATRLDSRDVEIVRELLQAPAPELDQLLLSVDRMTQTESKAASSEDRTRIVERLGLYGVRVAVGLIREQRDLQVGDLADLLSKETGLSSLIDAIDTVFVARRDTLRTLRSLDVIGSVLTTTHFGGGRTLMAEIERIKAAGHVFSEVRVLDSIRSGAVPLSAADAELALRLLGMFGSDPPTRVGLPTATTPSSLSDVVMDQLTHWRELAETPNAPEEVRDTATVLVRTCEGLLVSLSGPSSDPH